MRQSDIETHGWHYAVRLATTDGRRGLNFNSLTSAVEYYEAKKRCDWLPGRHRVLGGWLIDLDASEVIRAFGEPPIPDDEPDGHRPLRNIMWGKTWCVRCGRRKKNGGMYYEPEGGYLFHSDKQGGGKGKGKGVGGLCTICESEDRMTPEEVERNQNWWRHPVKTIWNWEVRDDVPQGSERP